MRTALTLVTGPAKEPVGLSEAKAWAKIDTTADDPLITSLIAAAREAAEQHIRRSLITQTWRLTLDLAATGWANDLPEGRYDLPVTELWGDLPTAIPLPKGPVQSVTAVTTYDTSNASSVFDSANYFLDAAGDRLVLNPAAAWPTGLRTRASCVIEYAAGYGDDPSALPQAVRTAVLMHVQRMYDGRLVCDLPEGCERLLRPYRRLGEP